MKKIIIGILTISYLLVSFIYLQVYSINELESIYTSKVKSIRIDEFENSIDNENLLNEIDKLSKDIGINIYKIVYNQLTDSEDVIITVYTALADENRLKDKFDIKYNGSSENLILSGGYLTSENKEIGVFNRDLIIKIKGLNEAVNENVIGEYLIQTDDINKFESIKVEFTDRLKCKLYDGEGGSITNGDSILNTIEVKYLILALILLISVLLAFIYYIIFRYKEFAIKKMLGHSDSKIIFKDLFKEILIMHCETLVISVLIVGVYLYYYNKLNYVLDYFKNLIIVLIMFSVTLIFIEMVVSLNIDNIKIKNMLNNKKPMVLIQSLNYISKLSFSIVLVAIIINLLGSYNSLIYQNKNLEKWKTTNNYVYVNMSDKYRNMEQITWNYNQGLRCKDFFKYYNDKGGLLISPSNYILYNRFYEKEILENRKEYDPIDGNALEVNAEYLRQNPIYDVNGNEIFIEDEYGDYLIILVPEKYNEVKDELLELYKEIYQFRRFINEDIYSEYMNIEKIEHPDIKIEIIYTKNGQESFLYNPELEEENQNSIKDAIHIVINSENIGSDSYLSFISGGNFFAKVDGSMEGSAYSKIEDDIKKLNMEKDILSANTLYSEVDSYIYKLENTINEYIISMIIILILEILLTVYIIINYIQRNKYINAIKRINGYSYIRRHNKFILLIVGTWGIILIGGYILGMSSTLEGLKIIISLAILEILIIYVVLKNIENDEILSVLKTK
ncbi:DUF1430 domain-containing protein [Clostridium sp. D53t1_180928_C8]|uniref:DUF1430 domain-containing protein n=1 Tax=Clostridium sp. D53t1_180928_C8 TaxID=2787101 RepID=UPI0018A9C6A1|nr:DUF1430 domain-containing protein [Clostridium sp. D53t1_180928_C8]